MWCVLYFLFENMTILKINEFSIIVKNMTKFQCFNYVFECDFVAEGKKTSH